MGRSWPNVDGELDGEMLPAEPARSDGPAASTMQLWITIMRVGHFFFRQQFPRLARIHRLPTRFPAAG